MLPRDTDPRTETVGAPDSLAPVFEVFLGTTPDKPATLKNSEPDLDVDAVERICKSLNERILAGKDLIPLAGPWGERKATTNDVLSVTFEESIEGNFPCAKLQIKLHNVHDPVAGTYRYTDIPNPKKPGIFPLIDYGRPLVLRMGYPRGGKKDAIQPVFDGIIVTIDAHFPADAEPTLEITAVDRRDRLRANRGKRGKSYRPQTVEAIIGAVVASKGLRLAVTREQQSGGVRRSAKRGARKAADQDLLQFVAVRAKRASLEMTAFGDTVFLQIPRDNPVEVLTFRYRRGLISFTPQLNAAGRPTKATVVSRDPSSSKRISATVETEDLKKERLAPPGDTVLDRIRKDGGAGDRELVVTNFQLNDDEECRELATAILKRNLDQTFTAAGELLGDPRVRVRKTLNIEGTGRYDGDWYVTMTRHRFGPNGYQTSFNARRNRALELAEEIISRRNQEAG